MGQTPLETNAQIGYHCKGVDPRIAAVKELVKIDQYSKIYTTNIIIPDREVAFKLNNPAMVNRELESCTT